MPPVFIPYFLPFFLLKLSSFLFTVFCPFLGAILPWSYFQTKKKTTTDSIPFLARGSPELGLLVL